MSLPIGESGRCPQRNCQANDPNLFFTRPLCLGDCLSNFTSVEVLADTATCNSCGVSVQREKQLTIETLPNVLVLHLKRFGTLGSQKITENVEFPTDQPLDLGPFLSRWRAGELKSSPPVPHLYALNAVVNHHGDAYSGHYTCYIKEGGHWFHCDDHCITKTDVETVKHSEGYLLFYVRHKVMRMREAR